jgi:AcrR family transcriptional regulator
MSNVKRRRGVSRDEWSHAALEELGSGRVSDLSIQELARKLGISKSGFYWHFTDKTALYKEVLEYWKHELTEVVSANPKMLELPPEGRLLRIAETVFDHDLGGYDVGIWQWALKDSQAAKAVKQVNKMRLDFVVPHFLSWVFPEMNSRRVRCFSFATKPESCTRFGSCPRKSSER